LKLFARAFGWALPKPERAAERVLHLLLAEEVAGLSGGYFGDRKQIKVPAQVDDRAANAELWRISERLVGKGAELT
jgi:retinol dehydrogenase-13